MKLIFVILATFCFSFGLIACEEEVAAEALGRISESALPVNASIYPSRPILGHDANLSCVAPNGNSLKECRWEQKSKNSRQHLIIVTDKINQTEYNEFCNCSYRYIGTGLDKGDCSISIVNVSKLHASSWECWLTSKDATEIWLGKLDINAYDSYSKPYFEENVTEIAVALLNTTTSVKQLIKCCVDGGDPSLQLQIDIRLGNEKQADDVTYLENDGRNCGETVYTFTSEDNRKPMVCTATYTYGNKRWPLISSVPVQVNFGPRFLPGGVSNQLMNNNSDLRINVSFTAQPYPIVDWYLFTDVENDVAFKLQNHPRYKSDLLHDGELMYFATLTILDFLEEDYKRVFKVKISNPFGTNEKSVKVGHSADAITESDKYWTFILLGIAAVIAVAIVIAVLCLVFKSRGKRQSYAPPRVTYYTSATDDSAADENK